jgi:hypothetical protein
LNLYKIISQDEIKLYKMSEPENKIEDEYEPGSEIQPEVCCICYESIDSAPTMQLLCKHILHTECGLGWMINKRTCPVCRQKTLGKKERLEKERIYIQRKWRRSILNLQFRDIPPVIYSDGKKLKRHIPSKISPELAKFLESDYNDKMASYNKEMANTHWLWQFFISKPEKYDFNARISRHDIDHKISQYILKHHLYSKDRSQILVNKNPRLRKLLKYPKKKYREEYLTSVNIIFYIEKHFIED